MVNTTVELRIIKGKYSSSHFKDKIQKRITHIIHIFYSIVFNTILHFLYFPILYYIFAIIVLWMIWSKIILEFEQNEIDPNLISVN